MSTTFNFAEITTEADIKNARDALTKRLAEIKKGLTKDEPVANGGAGKAVEEPVTPVKVTKAKKAAVKTVPEEVKPVAKAAEAKNTDGKREIAFPVTASHTKALKEGLKNPDTKQFTKDKQSFKKYCESLADSDWDAKNLDEHVADWLKLKTEPKAEEPITFDILSIGELKEMKGLTETKTVGIYWHPETGRHVTGQTDSEEGLDEVGDYLVGENTKRVYDNDEKFLGFAGIGKFESMKA
jgi:ATP-dependent exoDNAse (exonuclease V) beta subunit